MIKQGRNAVIQQKMRNSAIYAYFMSRFFQVATSRYKWGNMGPLFNQRFTESALFEKGWATIWYNDIAGSFLSALPIPGVNFDLYGDFVHWDAQTIRQEAKRFKLNNYNAVIVYDSYLRSDFSGYSAMPMSPMQQLDPLCEKMALIYQSMCVNINSLGCPIIITGTKEQRLSLENKVNQFDLRLPYIFVNSDFTNGTGGLDDMKALRTECPNNIQSFRAELDSCWQEGLCVLGVDNLGVTKKERLNIDETHANDVQTTLIAEEKLQSRKTACEKLNELFGSHCTVELSSGSMYISPYTSAPGVSDDDGEPDNLQQPNAASGGVNNGTVYSNGGATNT